MQLFAPVT